MLRDCQNKSQLLKGTVQAEHRNTGGGNLNSIQVKTEALRREVAAQGGLTEHEKRLWREPSLHGSSPPPACPECQMPTPVSQPVPRSSQRPGTLWFSLNQTQGLPSRALAPFQSLASSGWEFCCQPLTRLPSPPSDLWPQQVASLLWVPFPR